MTSNPRYTHSFSLNQEDEDRMQKVLSKIKSKGGIIDIVLAGIDRFLEADDVDKIISRSRKIKK